MSRAKTLAELVDRGVRFEVDEAVAVTQRIATSNHGADAAHRVRSLDTVWLDSDGSVTCTAGASEPAVVEMGQLLHSMLPYDGTRMPAALRYVIARALMRVEAPPFDSLEDFASALQRFAPPDPSAVLRQLFARGHSLDDSPVPSVTAAVPTDRRRTAPSVAELRRQLREADEERYLLLMARDAAAFDRATLRANPDPMDDIADRVLIRADADSSPVPRRAGVRFRRSTRFVLAAAVVGAAFGIGYVGMPHLLWRTVLPSLMIRSPLHADGPTSGPTSPATTTKQAPDSDGQSTVSTDGPGPSSSAASTGKSDEPDANRRQPRGRKPARDATRSPRIIDR